AAADEQAAGAGLTRLSLLVTATVDTLDQLPAARAVLEQLAGQARLRLRPCYGSQSASFTAALGVGVLPTDASRVPDQVRDAL
ncbi:MAG: SCO6880 family protein, partial [Propionicimonas sp.]